jgi:hypothetical protein
MATHITRERRQVLLLSLTASRLKDPLAEQRRQLELHQTLRLAKEHRRHSTNQ